MLSLNDVTTKSLPFSTRLPTTNVTLSATRLLVMYAYPPLGLTPISLSSTNESPVLGIVLGTLAPAVGAAW